jgi:hypothetical protein
MTVPDVTLRGEEGRYRGTRTDREINEVEDCEASCDINRDSGLAKFSG